MTADGVVNHLRDQNGLADAGAAEQPGLAASFQRRQDVDGLDAGFKDFRDGGLIAQRNGFAVNRSGFAPLDIALLVDGVAENIEHPSQQLIPHGNLKGFAGVGDHGAAGQALRRRQGDAPDGVVVQLCKHLDDNLALFARRQHIADRRGDGKVDVNNAAANG